MRRPVTSRTREICERYKRAIELGTPRSVIVGELSVMFDVLRPAIWKALRAGGILPPYAPRQEGGSGRPYGGGVPGYTQARRDTSEKFHRSTRADVDLMRHLSERAHAERAPGQTLQSKLNELRKEFAAPSDNLAPHCAGGAARHG